MPKIIDSTVNKRINDGTQVRAFFQATMTPEEIAAMDAKTAKAVPNPLSAQVFFVPRMEDKQTKTKLPAMLVIAFARAEVQEGIASLPAEANPVRIARDNTQDVDYVAIRGREKIRHALHTLGEGETLGRPTVSTEMAGLVRSEIEFLM